MARLSDQRRAYHTVVSTLESVCFNHALGGRGGSVKTQCHRDIMVSAPERQQCLHLNQLSQLGPSCLDLNQTGFSFYIL